MEAISSKIAYFKKKETFEAAIPTIPSGLNPVVFIEDTREMWTCGTYFSIGYPGIQVSETGGTVRVEIGNSFFLLSTTGESISVRRGDGNRIILSSNALSRIDTEAPLEWNASESKLYHKASGATAGSYGQSVSIGNASVFSIPHITIDPTGHITSIVSRNVEIRDYVEQLSPSNTSVERDVLLSHNASNNSIDTAQVRKANGMTFNDGTKKLTVSGGIISNGIVNVNHADLVVTDGYLIGKLKGNVEGEATPKIHLSTKPEFGGSSTELYGHVKLQDVLSTKPDPSSSNASINNTNVVAIAASPLMVWNAIETAKSYSDKLLGSNNAMLFKGAIEAGISSPGATTPTAEVGNTYVVTFGSGTYKNGIGYINGEAVEIGDLLICKTSTSGSTSSNWEEVGKNWTYVQTNTTGVVSGPSSSITGQVAVFSNTTGRLIRGLDNGNPGQVLTINNTGVPAWITPGIQTWRPIKYIDKTDAVKDVLSGSTDSGALTFKAAGNLEIEWDSANKVLTFTSISDNTWRPVFVHTVSSSSLESIGDSTDLRFSSDFLWIDGELVDGWAYVDSLGNVTYSR